MLDALFRFFRHNNTNNHNADPDESFWLKNLSTIEIPTPVKKY